MEYFLYTYHARAVVKPAGDIRDEQNKCAQVHADIYPSDHGLLAAPHMLNLGAECEEAIEHVDGCRGPVSPQPYTWHGRELSTH